MPVATLRLFRDQLAPGRSCALRPANRVLYALSGEVAVIHAGATLALSADSAWHGTGACVVRTGEAEATVLRWELVAAGSAPDGEELVLEHAMDLAPAAAWLMRCDRVDFDPGGVALPHRHCGGGIRCLVAGALEVTVGAATPRLVRLAGPGSRAGASPCWPARPPGSPRASSALRSCRRRSAARARFCTSIQTTPPAAGRDGTRSGWTRRSRWPE